MILWEFYEFMLHSSEMLGSLWGSCSEGKLLLRQKYELWWRLSATFLVISKHLLMLTCQDCAQMKKFHCKMHIMPARYVKWCLAPKNINSASSVLKYFGKYTDLGRFWRTPPGDEVLGSNEAVTYRKEERIWGFAAAKGIVNTILPLITDPEQKSALSRGNVLKAGICLWCGHWVFHCGEVCLFWPCFSLWGGGMGKSEAPTLTWAEHVPPQVPPAGPCLLSSLCSPREEQTFPGLNNRGCFQNIC